MKMQTIAYGFARGLNVLVVAAMMAGLALSVAPARVVHAIDPADYTVTKEADTNDGTCDVSDCSLREAITAANAAGGDKSIYLPGGTYVLDLIGSGEDANATGDLDITDDVTINGAGEGTTIIDGNGTDRVLHVFSSAKVVINDVTIRKGKADDG